MIIPKCIGCDEVVMGIEMTPLNSGSGSFFLICSDCRPYLKEIIRGYEEGREEFETDQEFNNFVAQNKL